MNKKSVSIIILFAVTLFLISCFTSGAGVNYKTTTDMIQDVYYDNATNTYYAETSTHWHLPLSRSKQEDRDKELAYNELYNGRLAKIRYDDNGGSSNQEDWTLKDWKLESR